MCIRDRLKIEVKKTGTLKSGYEIDTESITPETVSITAPQSILNTVSKAAVTVDISGKSSDIRGNYLIEFYNASGEKIVNPNISKSVEFAEAFRRGIRRAPLSLYLSLIHI